MRLNTMLQSPFAASAARELAVAALLLELDDDGVPAQVGLELVGRALCHDAALVDDRSQG